MSLTEALTLCITGFIAGEMDSWIRENPVIESGIDLFQSHDIEKGLALGGTVISESVSAISPLTGPITFKVESNDSTFFQLHKTRLVGRLKVVQNENTALTSVDKVDIANYLPHTLFKASLFILFMMQCVINLSFTEL